MEMLIISILILADGSLEILLFLLGVLLLFRGVDLMIHLLIHLLDLAGRAVKFIMLIATVLLLLGLTIAPHATGAVVTALFRIIFIASDAVAQLLIEIIPKT